MTNSEMEICKWINEVCYEYLPVVLNMGCAFSRNSVVLLEEHAEANKDLLREDDT